jgi:hypothetical protein
MLDMQVHSTSIVPGLTDRSSSSAFHHRAR